MANLVFATGATTSSTLDLTTYEDIGRQRVNMLVFPSGWLAATVTFLSSSDLGATYQTVYLPGGTAYSVTAGAGDEVAVDLGVMAPLSNIKIVSSVAQSAGPTVTAILVDPSDAAGLASGSGGSIANSGSAAPSAVMEIGGVARTTTTEATYSDGALAPFNTDLHGNPMVFIANYLSYEDAANSVAAETLKPIIGSTYSWLLFVYTQSAANQQVKGSAGQFRSFYAWNTGTTVGYFQVWNGIPGSGALLASMPIPAGTTNSPGSAYFGSETFGENGIYCATSIYIAFSTTALTYTAETTLTSFGGGGTYF